MTHLHFRRKTLAPHLRQGPFPCFRAADTDSIYMWGKKIFPHTFSVPPVFVIRTDVDLFPFYFLLATALTTKKLTQARPSTALNRTAVSVPMLEPQPLFAS